MLAFLTGSSLIFIGTNPEVPFLSESFCFGGFFSCPDSGFSLCWLVLGTLFAYLAYPIAKMGSDEFDSEESLLWNKRVSGISFVLSGTVVTILSFVDLLLYGPNIICDMIGCPALIFSLVYIGYWIYVFFGLTLLSIGLGLLALNSRETSELLQQLEASSSVL